MILVMRVPQRQNTVRGRERREADGKKKMRTVRESPYPPNFRRMAAKIIDPAMGASTWALGNQRWKPYIGIFMTKAKRQNNHQIDERRMWWEPIGLKLEESGRRRVL